MSRIKIASHSILVQNFHEFFNLLLRQKEFALRAKEGKSPQALASEAQEKIQAVKEHPELPATDDAPTIPPEWEVEVPETRLETTPETPPTQDALTPTIPPVKSEDATQSTSQEQKATRKSQHELVTTIQRRLSLLLEEQAIQSTVQAGEFAVSSYQE